MANDNPSYNSPNPMDDFLPGKSWQFRLFGGVGGIQVATMLLLVWLASFPEYRNDVYWLTDRLNTWWQYGLLIAFLGVLWLVWYWVRSSENVLNPTHQRQPMNFGTWGMTVVAAICSGICLHAMIASWF